MADLTPVNCAVGIGCVDVGRDLAAADPAKLRTQIFLDDRYMECDSNLLRVKIRDEAGEINAAALPSPAQGCGNLIRVVNQAGNKGLFAFAPQLIPKGDGTRQGISTTVGNYSAISHTISYTNPDTNCKRLVCFDATLSTIVEEADLGAPGDPVQLDNLPIFAGVMEGLGTQNDINGVTIKKYAVTLNGRGSGSANNIMNDARHVRTYYEVPAGGTVQQTWRMRTVRSNGIISAGVDRGFLCFDAWAKIEQGVVL